MNRRWMKIGVIAAAALVVLGVVAALLWLNRPLGDAFYASLEIQAQQSGERGIAPETSFDITTNRGVGEEKLRAMLDLDPVFSYTLSGGGKRWILTPDQLLSANTVYVLGIQDDGGTLRRSFAFQTESNLMVAYSYPGKDASYVDPATGIELTFNTVGVDPTDYFEILPETEGRFELTESTAVFQPAGPLEPGCRYQVTLKAGLKAKKRHGAQGGLYPPV